MGERCGERREQSGVRTHGTEHRAYHGGSEDPMSKDWSVHYATGDPIKSERMGIGLQEARLDQPAQHADASTPKQTLEQETDECARIAEGVEAVPEAEEEEYLGSRRTVRKHDPRQPSEQDGAAHEMTHPPFFEAGAPTVSGKTEKKTVPEQEQSNE